MANTPRGKGVKAPKKKRASLKNQLRSNERALKKVSDAGARATLQAAREALLLQVKQVKKVKLEDKYKRKYGKVRFFERKRILKARKKLQAAIEAQGWANGEQRARLKQLDEDAEYVQHFPKDEKYVSLFVTDGDQVHAAAERVRLRALIKSQRAQAALLTEKDEGGFTAADLPHGLEDGDGDDLGDDEFFAAPQADGEEEEEEDALFTQGAHAHTPKPAPKQLKGEQRQTTPGGRLGAGGVPNGGGSPAGGAAWGSAGGGKKRRREEQQRGQRDDRGGAPGSGKKQRQLPQAGTPNGAGTQPPGGFGGGVQHADGGAQAPHGPSGGRFMKADGPYRPPKKVAKPKKKKDKQPARSRAEGGRKRAKKGKKGKA